MPAFAGGFVGTASLVTTRMPMYGPSTSHHTLLGNCGSLSFQSSVSGMGFIAAGSITLSLNDPPMMQKPPSAATHHSAALPQRSAMPMASAFLLPSLWLAFLASAAVHACSTMVAAVTPEALAMHSHSATVGRRYVRPVFFESHSQNWTAPFELMEMAGQPWWP